MARGVCFCILIFRLPQPVVFLVWLQPQMAYVSGLSLNEESPEILTNEFYQILRNKI